jgi:hypothetical protein
MALFSHRHQQRICPLQQGRECASVEQVAPVSQPEALLAVDLQASWTSAALGEHCFAAVASSPHATLVGVRPVRAPSNLHMGKHS